MADFNLILNSKFYLSIERFDILPKDIECIFLLGSFLWGTNHESSDYDLTIVIKGSNSKIKDKNFTNINIDGQKYDLMIMTLNHYQNRIKEGSFLEIITLYLDNKFILKTSANLVKFKSLVTKDSLYNKTRDNCRDTLKVVGKLVERKTDKDNLLAIKKIIHLVRILSMVIEYFEKYYFSRFDYGINIYQDLVPTYKYIEFTQNNFSKLIKNNIYPLKVKFDSLI